MVTNLLKIYPDFLDLVGLTEVSNRAALYPVFKRDFIDRPSPLIFRNRPVDPTPKQGEEPMETLYRHLTTVVTDKATRKREFESDRCFRLHWVLVHLNGSCRDSLDVFSIEDADGPRTYIYNAKHKYVVILEPYRDSSGYYLLTAYHLKGGDSRKIENKRKRRLPEIL